MKGWLKVNLQPIDDDGLDILGTHVCKKTMNYFVRTGKGQVKDVANLITNDGKMGVISIVIREVKIDKED